MKKQNKTKPCPFSTALPGKEIVALKINDVITKASWPSSGGLNYSNGNGLLAKDVAIRDYRQRVSCRVSSRW